MTERARYQKLVANAKRNITEISPQDAAAKLKRDEAVIIDVRDKDEWDEGHIPGAMHMSRSPIELDIEEKVPDPNALIICHCGGGGRRRARDGESAEDGLQKCSQHRQRLQNVENSRTAHDEIVMLLQLPSSDRTDPWCGIVVEAPVASAVLCRRLTKTPLHKLIVTAYRRTDSGSVVFMVRDR